MFKYFFIWGGFLSSVIYSSSAFAWPQESRIKSSMEDATPMDFMCWFIYQSLLKLIPCDRVYLTTSIWSTDFYIKHTSTWKNIRT